MIHIAQVLWTSLVFCSVATRAFCQVDAYGAVIARDNPVAFYRLADLQSTTAADEVGKSSAAPFGQSPGTFNNGVLLGVAGVPGCGGQTAAFFDGVNDNVRAPNLIGSDFTLELWVRHSGSSRMGSAAYDGDGLVWADIGGTANDWCSAILNNRFAFTTGNPDRTIESASYINTNEWVHLVASRVRGGATKLYVNGKLEAAGMSNNNILSGVGSLAIGGNVLDGRYAKVTIADVSMYTYALSDQQIAEHFLARFAAGTARTSIDKSHACSSDRVQVNVSTGGPGPFTYHWRKGGKPLDIAANPSAATDTLVLSSVQAPDAGSYDCIVSNSCGTVTSNAADLDVDCNCTPATPLTMAAGVVDGFSTSNGAEPATPRSGFAAHLEARNPRPFLPFDLVPSGGTENRFLAHSFVGLPGDLSSARLEFRVRAGGSNNPVAEGTDLFRVGHSIGANDFQGLQTFFGNENTPSLFTFAWRLWTVDPRGDQTITTADLSQTILDRMNTLGYLDFMVEDDTGVDYVTLRAMRAAKRSGINVPWVRTQPNQTTIACPGTAVNLAVAAGGSGPFTYLWRKNQSVIDVSGNPSAATATLNLGNVGPGAAAEYDCIITNSCSTVTSNPATLTVCAADFDCDGFITFEDFDSFVSAFESGLPSADFNADGFLTFEDFDAFVAAFEIGC